MDGDVLGTVVQAHTIQGSVHVHNHTTMSAVVLPHRTGVVPPRPGFFQNRAAFRTFTISPGRAAVLTGLGGVGKTQLAVDYAERLWSTGEVELLMWMTAASADAIVAEYARVAGTLTGIDQPDSNSGAQRFLEWLAATKVRWLLVLDDLQLPADLSGLWPPSTRFGRVVVTTRRADAALRANGQQLIYVGGFTLPEAHSYLRAVLAERSDLLDDEVDELARDLGLLPLALAQAGAYLLDRNLSCGRYRTRLADRRRLLASLFPDGEGADRHQRTVAVTWSLSIEQANRLDPVGVARPLLEIASALAPNGIPTDLFTAPAVLALLTTRSGRRIDADDAWDGLGCLQRLNLVTSKPGTGHGGVRVHSLVQRANWENLPVETKAIVTLAAADALVEIWPAVERDTELSQALRASAEALNRAGGDHLWGSCAHSLLLRAGRSAGESGLASEARAYFTAFADDAAERLGPDHVDTLAARSELAFWRGEAGDSAGAVEGFASLLSDELRVLGPDHSNTLDTRHRLAFWRGEAGDRAGSMTALEDLLADRQRVLGRDHPDTLTTGALLARRRGQLGYLELAVASFESLLTVRLRVLGRDHPDTLTARSDLAFWRAESRDLEGAIAGFTDVLADQTRVLGPDHPFTLITRNNIAFWRADLGDLAGAIDAFETLLADRLRILGPDHPDTFSTRSNLEFWRGERGDPIGALQAFQILLADQLRVLGPDHPDTLLTLHNVARWRGEAGDPVGAVTAFRDLLIEERRVFGRDHSRTFHTRHHLARFRGAAGDRAGAVTAFRDLLADISLVLGPGHPDVQRTRDELDRWLTER